MPNLSDCKALTFDLFGTVLDLGGSLTPYIAEFVERRDALDQVDPAAFWGQLRHRQRIEQYQDSLVQLGHTGYLETARKAFVYVAQLNDLAPSDDEVDDFMRGWQQLNPFPDVADGLRRLDEHFDLVALSNGNPWFLDHLVRNRIRFDFHDVISVEVAGSFKPHPGVYRSATRLLGLEPGEVIMVSSNSFDVMGARTCGLRGIFVNRELVPYEDTDDQYLPDLEVADFGEMADALLG